MDESPPLNAEVGQEPTTQTPQITASPDLTDDQKALVARYIKKLKAEPFVPLPVLTITHNKFSNILEWPDEGTQKHDTIMANDQVSMLITNVKPQTKAICILSGYELKKILDSMKDQTAKVHIYAKQDDGRSAPAVIYSEQNNISIILAPRIED